MRDGFIKVASVTPKVKVADVDYNTQQVIALYHEAVAEGAKIIVFPELVLTSYSCGDLFLQSSLINSSAQALERVIAESRGIKALTFVGIPFELKGRLYNVAAVLSDGRLLGLVPKCHVPNYSEYYEKRYFAEGAGQTIAVTFLGRTVPFGARQIFEFTPVRVEAARGSLQVQQWRGSDIRTDITDIHAASNEKDAAITGRDAAIAEKDAAITGRNAAIAEKDAAITGRNAAIAEKDAAIAEKDAAIIDEIPGGMRVSCEICEDLWTMDPPDTYAALAGANVIVNLSASTEVAGKSTYRRMLVQMTSARLVCGYIYASAGEGESSQDLVFSGQRMIAENGTLLACSERFTTGVTISEIDTDRLRAERRRMTTLHGLTDKEFTTSYFALEMENTLLTRTFDRRPFVPSVREDRASRCEEILMIQALGLKKRLEHIRASSAVIGVSGGLDSALALLVTVRAFDLLGLDRKNIHAVTMPCFGTTSRTYKNAEAVSKALGCGFTEISIKDALKQHFIDIRHDPSVTDITYENAQARERTLILMDLANQTGGIVVGTGDLSELALGWATYNGDHMSMYGVNSSVPKTLVRHLIRYYADTCSDGGLKMALEDIIDTPVSPELLPPKDGKIVQKTEDLVGPYELHDFFLYYMMRFGFPPHKIFRIAKHAFEGEFDAETILRWLKVFYRRFFSQQYKRSCIPDGPKVGSVALSPRGDLRMPSDASCAVWEADLEIGLPQSRWL